MRKSNPQSGVRQRQHKVQQPASDVGAIHFFNALTRPELLELTDSLPPEHRERLDPPTMTLSIFIKQTLAEDASCQYAVNGWTAQRIA